MSDLALAFSDQEHYEATGRECWRCELPTLVAKAVPNGAIVWCPRCYRICETWSFSEHAHVSGAVPTTWRFTSPP